MWFVENFKEPVAGSESFALDRERRFLTALGKYDNADDGLLKRGLEICLDGLCKDLWEIGRRRVSKAVWDATFEFRLRNCIPTYS